VIRLDPFYPIAPDFDWLSRFVRGGARFVQLRVKDVPPEALRTQIADSIALCRAQDCRLVVNDFWQDAIALGADFVHLGQEDLAAADLSAIKHAGLRLGISTHSPDELDTALLAAPDYVALGPIYETKLKVMPWAPQGLEKLAEWKDRIPCALVAIGGITAERAPVVLAAGADSAAVITDLITHTEPDLRLRRWLDATDPWRSLSTEYPHADPGSGGA
jgi:thiamine-phosphate pyrophosphorylase